MAQERLFRFLRHFDYGLLREVPESLQYDMLQPDGHWHQILLNPFTASMSVISEVAAAGMASGADLYAPATTRELPGGRVEPIPG
jgi:hypothetical protein